MQGQGQAALLHGGNYGDTALHSLDRPWCTPRNMGERCRGRLQHTHRNANITEILASEKYPILKVMAMTNLARMQCWVTRLDVTQEIEKWAESAALASPAHCAHFYVSCVTSCLVTQCQSLTFLHETHRYDGIPWPLVHHEGKCLLGKTRCLHAGTVP